MFSTDGNDDHDGHGPAFHEHMFRINKATGTKISVYHSFHDEVDNYRTHWWQCDGPCRSRKPFYGIVKRAMNRVPGPNDSWWSQHQSTCGGTYTKIKEPENYGKKKKTADKRKKEIPPLKSKGQPDIRSVFNKVPKKEIPGTPSTSAGSSKIGGGSKGNIFGFGGPSFESPTKSSGGIQNKIPSSATSAVGSKIGGGGGRGNIFGFGGTSFKSPNGTSGGLQTKGRSGAFVQNPGWKTRDNSSNGHVINSSNNDKKTTSTTTSAANGQSSGVQNQLRKVWAHRFGQENDQDSSCSKQSQNSYDNQMVKCPICSKSMSPSLINKHLDQECLLDTTTNEMEPLKEEMKNEYTCPSCQRSIHKDLMNTHIDFCATV